MGQRLDDEYLEGVSGGVSYGGEVSPLGYGMENDPLYQQFSDFWKKKEGRSITGMVSRAEFLNAFRQWVSDGIPENISKWYDGMKA